MVYVKRGRSRFSRKPAGSLASKVASLAKKVRAQAPEHKEFLTTLSNTGVGNAGYLMPLDTMAQGNSGITRLGNQITPKSLKFRYVLESEVADAYNQFRVIVVQAKNRNPLIVQDFPSLHGSVTDEMRVKYTVMYDKTAMLQHIYAGNVAGVALPVSSYHQFKGSCKPRRRIEYVDGSSTSTGSTLYAFFVSDSAAVAHPDMEEWNSLLAFTDA